MKKLFRSLPFLMACMLLLCLLGGCAGNAEETFRNARVISVRGTAVLLREETSMDVYEGLVLKGGDQIATSGDGRADLKLDGDKYVVLEPNTTVTLELEGDPQKGAIRLHQVSGTIHHTIENPLSKDDCYEVHTPDAVMAVRGTEFLTTVYFSGEGTQTTTQVQEGTVDMTPNNSQDPTRSLEAGDSATAETPSGEDSPSHFLDCCLMCRQELSAGENHLLSCGDGHYSCDGERHELLPCTHFACAEGDHVTLLPCGAHPACAPGDHTSAHSCGHYACAEGDHETLLKCGVHPACTPGDHTGRRSCGHYLCTEGTHNRTFSCGHYTCWGGLHNLLECGHFACEGKDHNETYGCGHRACTSGDHQLLGCGHYTCNQEDLEHAPLSCGNYACLGNGHERCYSCGSCICTGDHSALACGHLTCQGGSHDPLACGHYSCDSGSHDLVAACGHYSCDGRTHDAFHPCGYPLCADGHAQLECSHCPLCNSGQTHTRLSCGSFACQGGHTTCAFCGNCTCTGAHGSGVCDVT